MLGERLLQKVVTDCLGDFSWCLFVNPEVVKSFRVNLIPRKSTGTCRCFDYWQDCDGLEISARAPLSARPLWVQAAAAHRTPRRRAGNSRSGAYWGLGRWLALPGVLRAPPSSQLRNATMESQKSFSS